MNKRGRPPKLLLDDDGESSDAPLVEHGRKKKKMDPLQVCLAIYEMIRNHKKDDGALLCDSFIRIPKKRQDPAYYEVVANPIDLQRIQQKIKTEEYDDVEDMTADMMLLVKNAKQFHKKNTPEYKDAVELYELYKACKAKFMDDDRSSAESERKDKIILKVGKLKRKAAAMEARKHDPDVDETSESSCNLDDDNASQIEDLFTATMQATDADNRPLNEAFMHLPSRKKYPDYYDVIDNPIDLRMIAKKIQSGQYTNLNDVEKDLLLVMRNACSFNEPGSQIYKDAKLFKKFIISKKSDIVQGKNKPRAGGRKRARNPSQKLSAVTAAIQDEEDSESVQDDDDDATENEASEAVPEDPDNPLWQLFDVVKNTSNGGYALCEPFWRLPSRRYYSDYYHEIQNPVSLLQIQNKLAKGNYGTVSEVAGDLNIMFENAKKYNRPESRLYKDAVKLQKVMQNKVKELLDFDHDSDSGSDSDNCPILKRDSPKKGKPGKGGFIRGKYNHNIPLRKRMLSICKALTDYSYDDGRQPILMFMEKPSRKLYPEYYKVITEPIDLLQIQANIKAEKYTNEEQFVNDLKTMFSNCRLFNEENSVVFKDANVLEQVLNDKLKELSQPQKSTVKVYRPPRKKIPIDVKLKAYYDTVRDYQDNKGKKLSEVFQKLPSRADYPDYYEIIKRPMDMDKIRIKLQHYESIEELAADFMLMLDNACKFNEPDSQIYKSALQLQRVVIQTKRQLLEDGNHPPNAQAAVQELLTTLFSAVYNHQDEEGRCFSDSLQELPEFDELDGKKQRGLSLDTIKRRLDRGLYKRLDRFQEDVFACLERARRLSRTDSQVFEDSIELQAFFVRHRDELCRNGEVLSSPALNYNLLHLSAAVEQQKQNKLLKESPEEENDTKTAETEAAPTPVPSGTPMVQEGSQKHYHIGDFVYITPRERNMDPNIIHIIRGWTNSEGIQMLFGDCYYRPNETFHLQTRRFLEKEVFKSDVSIAVPLSDVIGRCCVMNVKDYFKYKPENFDDKDVYVCESRYSSRTRSFKKIKVFSFNLDRVTLTARAELLEPKRVMSVFKDKDYKRDIVADITELEDYEKIEEKKLPNIELMNMPVNPDISAYYQQLNVANGVIKTGDYVYVQMESGKMVCQIDTMWSNKEGLYFVKGPFFLRAHEIPYMPGRLFYRQEVFLGAMEEAHPIANVLSRCFVLEHSEFISCRPTEVEEKDIFICQCMYEEQQRQLTKLTNGLKRYTHSDTVLQDEVYYFRRLVNATRLPSETIQLGQPDVKSPLPPYETDSLLVPKVEQDLLSLMEDSMDGGPPSVGSGELPVASPLPASTPLTKAQKDQLQKSKGKDKEKGKIITGYILYSGEVRKTITVSHPDATFGEISRMVGNEWRQLTAEQKQCWEEKAAKMTADLKEQAALEDALHPQGTPIPNPPNLPNGWVFECLWDNCDYQFEDLSDCVEHVCADVTGHVATHFANLKGKDVEYQCNWKQCNRLKKNSPPFPNITRLGKHVKELHLIKQNGRVVPNGDRTKNFIPSRRPRPHATPNIVGLQLPSGQYSGSGNHPLISLDSPTSGTTPVMNARPAEPLFVTVPPRTQRLLHSDAYIKYIESLTPDTRYISNWDRMLRATQINTPAVDESRLPVKWLANGPGNYGNASTALWALRDFMLRDAFNLSKAV